MTLPCLWLWTWSWILIYRDFCFQPARASFLRLSTSFAQTWQILLARRKIEKFPKSPLQHHSFPFRIYYGVLSWIRLRGKKGFEYRECAGTEGRQRRKLSYLPLWNRVVAVDKNMGSYLTLGLTRHIFVSMGFTVLMALILHCRVWHSVTWQVNTKGWQEHSASFFLS